MPKAQVESTVGHCPAMVNCQTARNMIATKNIWIEANSVTISHSAPETAAAAAMAAQIIACRCAKASIAPNRNNGSD